nr:hypothetical protein Itr_chr01CG19760 [Ipomoea trifida]
MSNLSSVTVGSTLSVDVKMSASGKRASEDKEISSIYSFYKRVHKILEQVNRVPHQVAETLKLITLHLHRTGVVPPAAEWYPVQRSSYGLRATGSEFCKSRADEVNYSRGG